MRILLIKEHALTRSLPANLRLIPALEALGHRVIPVDVGALATVFGHDGAQQLVVQHARAFQPHLVLAFPPQDMLAPETCAAIRSLGVPLVGWRGEDAGHLARLAHRPAAQRRFLELDGAKFTVNATSSRRSFEAMQEMGLPSAAYLRMAGHMPFRAPLSEAAGPEFSYAGTADMDSDTEGVRGAGRVLAGIVAAGLQIGIWGDGWDQIPELEGSWQGAIPDLALMSLYQQTQINLNVGGWPNESVTPSLLDMAFAGGFQLVDCCDELEDYFEPDREITVVHDPTELLSKMAYHRVYPEARMTVALAARARAEREHTWAARWPEVLAAVDARWGRPIMEDDAPDSVQDSALDGVLTANRAMLHVCEAAGRGEEAWGYADAILRVAPRDYSALAAWARWAEAAGDPAQALRHWQLAAERFSPFAYSWTKPVALLGLQGAGGVVPGDPRAEAVWRQFNLALAMQDMEAMRALLPEMARIDFDGLEAFAVGLFRNDDFEMAARIYGELQREAPNHLDVLMGLARSLMCLDRPDEARPVLETIISVEPGHAEAKMLRSSTLQ